MKKSTEEVFAISRGVIKEMEDWNQKFGDLFGKFLIIFGIWVFIAFIFGIGH